MLRVSSLLRLPPIPFVHCLLWWSEVSPRDCLLRGVVGGRAERMWVSVFVFCLFFVGRVHGFSVGCIIVCWERVLISLFFALWRMVVLLRRMLRVTVSLSVFANEVVFGQGSNRGNVWLVFIFLPSLFWGFFSFCCCH